MHVIGTRQHDKTAALAAIRCDVDQWPLHLRLLAGRPSAIESMAASDAFSGRKFFEDINAALCCSTVCKCCIQGPARARLRNGNIQVTPQT
jgi:hypothetical protein